MAYELFYWQGIPGRGEFVRLALEAAGADYSDNPPGDVGTATPSFAPPYLRDGDLVIGQTANILDYIGPRLGLAPESGRDRLWVRQIQLTVTDFVAEIHDVHHPLGPGRYYEEQKDEALRRAGDFRDARVPKYLDWFETVRDRNPARSGWLAGDAMSYADLSVFHVLAGLDYAFPRLMGRIGDRYAGLRQIAAHVAAHRQVSAYLISPRRRRFNENGIFRHYPELDP